MIFQSKIESQKTSSLHKNQAAKLRKICRKPLSLQSKNFSYVHL